jgi:hypothetical protein
MAGTGTDFMLIASALHASGGCPSSRLAEQFVATARSGWWVREPLFLADTVGCMRLWVVKSVLKR